MTHAADGRPACLLAVVAVASAALGCAATMPEPETPQPPPPKLTVLLPPALPPDAGPPMPALAPTPPQTIQLEHSVRGRAIEAVVFEGTEGCVLVIGGVHGDEPAGRELVERLVAHLKSHPEARAGRRVVAIPRANPDGLAAGTRYNAAGVDVNRNFRAANYQAGRRRGRGPMSEPETRALVTAIARFRPSAVVSVHGPLACIDPDGGPASRTLADRMAAVSPLPVRDLAALPGSLGSYAGGTLGLTMVTYELDRRSMAGRDPDAYFAPHLEALLVAISEG